MEDFYRGKHSPLFDPSRIGERCVRQPCVSLATKPIEGHLTRPRAQSHMFLKDGFHMSDFLCMCLCGIERRKKKGEGLSFSNRAFSNRVPYSHVIGSPWKGTLTRGPDPKLRSWWRCSVCVAMICTAWTQSRYEICWKWLNGRQVIGPRFPDWCCMGVARHRGDIWIIVRPKNRKKSDGFGIVVICNLPTLQAFHL